mmetsp:Transcript_36311/g.83471  ORF Transcript_36311/g.83471 Transcript_36311/m.83471 type:complete len:124 (-) Transcript_36311:14-385(-)
MMGVMSLMEAYRINELRLKKQLHTHPLFQTARSLTTRRRENDGTLVARLNQSDLDDDPEPLPECQLCCWDCCPGLFPSSRQHRHQALPQDESELNVQDNDGFPSSSETRENRERFLRSFEQRQ